MAVLGLQVALTMITVSVMTKIAPYMSPARWLLINTGLIRYMHPSDEELKHIAIVPLQQKKGKRHHEKNGNAANDGTFHVPKQNNIQLETTKITLTDVVQLRFYAEFQWILDFAFFALIVYFSTEVYAHFLPNKYAQEVNLSMIWCILAVGFAYKMLMTLTGLYFEGEETGERSLVICMGFGYLFLAMMILIVDENTLETGLDEAYSSFNESASVFLAENAGLDSSGPASKLVLKFFIALWCSSIGALFTFPGLRMARMQWDVLTYTENRFSTMMLHLSFISPLFLTMMWVKPLSRDYLTQRIFKGMAEPMLTSDQFETLRLYMIVFVVLLRLAVMPQYLQSYLNMAYHKLEGLKQEAGKVTNMDIQKLIARVFYYLCVVTLQYVAPLIMILFLSLMYKTMGGGNWTGLWSAGEDASPLPVQEPEPVRLEVMPKSEVKIDKVFGDEEANEELSRQFSLAWHSLKHVFTSKVFRGLLGFSTWWCCLATFTSAAIGISYQSYFANV